MELAEKTLSRRTRVSPGQTGRTRPQCAGCISGRSGASVRGVPGHTSFSVETVWWRRSLDDDLSESRVRWTSEDLHFQCYSGITSEIENQRSPEIQRDQNSTRWQENQKSAERQRENQSVLWENPSSLGGPQRTWVIHVRRICGAKWFRSTNWVFEVL